MLILNDLNLLLFETAKVSLAALVVRNRLLYDVSYTETVCSLLVAIQNVYHLFLNFLVTHPGSKNHVFKCRADENYAYQERWRKDLQQPTVKTSCTTFFSGFGLFVTADSVSSKHIVSSSSSVTLKHLTGWVAPQYQLKIFALWCFANHWAASSLNKIGSIWA